MVGAVDRAAPQSAAGRAALPHVGYPVVPLIYILLAVLLVLDLAYLAPATSGIGYLLVLTGIPVYFIWRRSAARRFRHSIRSCPRRSPGATEPIYD